MTPLQPSCDQVDIWPDNEYITHRPPCAGCGESVERDDTVWTLSTYQTQERFHESCLRLLPARIQSEIHRNGIAMTEGAALQAELAEERRLLAQQQEHIKQTRARLKQLRTRIVATHFEVIDA